MKIGKKFLIFNICICIYMCAFCTFYFCVFGNNEKINENDPLVRKSYIDSIIASLKQNDTISFFSDEIIKLVVETVKENVLNEIKNNMNILNELKGNINNSAEKNVISYKPVFVNKGKVLIGGEGTEVILRKGKVVAYTINECGIVNVTKGKEIFNGNNVEENNLYIISRCDERGFNALSDSWFIVKGSYIIK